MRILHVITRFVRGGADENTLLSCNAQEEAGHEIHLVCGNEFHASMLSKLHPKVQSHALPPLVRRLSPVNDIRATLALYRLCRDLRPDVVHTHTSKAGFVGRAAAWAARVPVIIHGVHILPFLNVGPVQRLIYWVAEKMLVPVTDAFVDVSEGMKVECLRYGIGGEAKHLVVPSGMDVARFRAAQPVSDAELSAVCGGGVEQWHEAEIVLMVAAFEERKRQLAFLDVFTDVVKTRPKAVLLLAGDGPDRSQIEERIAALGLAGRVKLIGFRQDVERWMKRADVCVLSSEREGLPRVVVQYALAGRPIVATRLPGVEVVVQEGKNGFLVDSVEEMSAPILKTLSDRILSSQLSAYSQKLDLSPWSSDYMAQQLDDLYVSLLKKG